MLNVSQLRGKEGKRETRERNGEGTEEDRDITT
jgi:hypothetical protein